MTLPTEFLSLLPKIAAEPEEGPVYWLWVYDPDSDDVLLHHNERSHPARTKDHSDLSRIVTHPDRVQGYAYRIKNGWRITTHEHKAVKDPHVLYEVIRALKGESKRSTTSRAQLRAIKQGK